MSVSPILSTVTLLQLLAWNHFFPFLMPPWALFDLQRSRIPTSLFKNIVKDIDASLIHYGALKPRLGDNQLTEEARSCILAPVSF